VSWSWVKHRRDRSKIVRSQKITGFRNNAGSGDRNNAEEQHNSSLDAGSGAGNAGLSLAQMNQMTFGAGGGLAGHSLHAAKLLKESASAELEQQPQDSDLDDGHGHLHMQIVMKLVTLTLYPRPHEQSH